MSVLYPSDARQYTRLTLESLNKITRESLIEHYKKYYVPSGELAGISGDITPKDAVAKLEKALAGWKGGPVEEDRAAHGRAHRRKRRSTWSRGPVPCRPALMLANRAIERTNPDYIACMVMNQVLGSGPAARLFRIIREEKGYTYGVSSGFTATRVPATSSAREHSVRTEVTEPALADLLKEFQEIRDVPVPERWNWPVPSAPWWPASRSVWRIPRGCSQRWMQQREYGLPEDYWDTYAEKIMAMTAADVQRVAKKYVPLDNVQIIAVGDGVEDRATC